MTIHVLLFTGVIPSDGMQSMLLRTKVLGVPTVFWFTLIMFVLAVNCSRVFYLGVHQWVTGQRYTFFFPLRMKIVTEDVRLQALKSFLQGGNNTVTSSENGSTSGKDSGAESEDDEKNELDVVDPVAKDMP